MLFKENYLDEFMGREFSKMYLNFMNKFKAHKGDTKKQPNEPEGNKCLSDVLENTQHNAD